MRISMIVATDLDGVIGRDGDLPWRLPADLAHFKRTTMGKPIIMGRKTYESIGRPLPGRTNIVLTRDPSYAAQGCQVTDSVDGAVAAADGAEEVFVIGGAEIYALFFDRADRIYRTLVHAHVPGDVHFHGLDAEPWNRTSYEDHTADERHAHDYTFELWERRAARESGS